MKQDSASCWRTAPAEVSPQHPEVPLESGWIELRYRADKQQITNAKPDARTSVINQRPTGQNRTYFTVVVEPFPPKQRCFLTTGHYSEVRNTCSQNIFWIFGKKLAYLEVPTFLKN